jgi:hypothetical protein
MVFPSLDGSFGGVSAMAVRGDSLAVDSVFLEGFLEFVGAFVVEHVQRGRMSVVLEFLVKFCPGSCELACLAAFQRR